MVSLAAREDSRSGEETGGGTTAAFICTRLGATSCSMVLGAGAIMAPLSAGAVRACSRSTRVEAGEITVGLKAGAARLRSRETLGAGAMTLDSSLGA